MLLGVLSFIDLAGGVVAFTNSTRVLHSCRPQNSVTSHSLLKNKEKSFIKTNFLSSLRGVHKNYLTQSINTNIRAVLVAQGPIFNFTGQSKEEVIALSKAVELAYILIWMERTQDRWQQPQI